jgi:hypothetical protein
VSIFQGVGIDVCAIGQFTEHHSIDVCGGSSENWRGAQNTNVGTGQDANEEAENDDGDSKHSGLIADHDCSPLIL